MREEYRKIAPQVASDYVSGMAIMDILKKHGISSSWYLYDILKYQKVLPDRNAKRNVPTPSGIGVPMKGRKGARYRYTNSDNLYLVSAFVRAAHECPKGFAVTPGDLKKWFPAGTNMPAVVSKLRSLGWQACDTDAARSESKTHPTIPGPSIGRLSIKEIGAATARRFGQKTSKKSSVEVVVDKASKKESDDPAMDNCIHLDDLEDFVETCKLLGVVAVVWG